MKRAGLVFLFFVILVVIISVFLPSSFELERKKVVNADKEQIFKQVNDLKNWKNWAPWALKDATIYDIEESYSNPSFGKGATFIWESDNEDIGKGNIEVLESISNSYIKNGINFGFIESIGEWNFKDVEDGVEVTWGLNVEFGFNPISKFYGLFMEDQISPDYELGLERLKMLTENLPKIHKVEVEKKYIKTTQWYLSIRDTVSQQGMNNVHGKLYAQINQFMDKEGIVSEASPIVIYHLWDSIVDIEAGIPITDSIYLNDTTVTLKKILPSIVITAIHYGPYERLPETYFGINEWMRKNKVVVTGPPWESYLTDPSTEPNPKKWETAIYFPIE